MVDRIQKLIQYKKLTASKFADQVGVPRSTISHILSGRNNPSLEFLQKILDTFPDVKTEWLIRGEGGMLVSRNTLFPDEEYEVKKNWPVAERNRLENQDADADLDDYLPQNTANISDSLSGGKEIRSAEGDMGGKASTSETLESKVQSSEKNHPMRDDEKKAGTTPADINDQFIRRDGKKTTRVLFFYTDGTFAEFLPSE